MPSVIRRKTKAQAVYITPSHQYPTGVTMSASRRILLLNWAARSGAPIIEDDYDSEYRFESRPIASLQGMDTDGRVIYIGTFSKVMFPALRLGYLVIPKDLIAAFSAVREAADICSSTLYQAVLTDFIGEGHFARHIRRMRLLYAERRAALLKAIDVHMSDLLEVVGTDAGMHLLTLLPQGYDDVAVQRGRCNGHLSHAAVPVLLGNSSEVWPGCLATAVQPYIKFKTAYANSESALRTCRKSLPRALAKVATPINFVPRNFRIGTLIIVDQPRHARLACSKKGAGSHHMESAPQVETFLARTKISPPTGWCGLFDTDSASRTRCLP